MSPIATILFYTGAALMLLDAGLYSFGALGPIRAALKPADTYWNRRLLLNLLLANMGLYFTALYTGIGAFLASSTPNAARLVLILSVIVCFYGAVSVPLLTPRDWPHVRSLVLWLACSFLQGCFLDRLCVAPIVWRSCIITVGPSGYSGYIRDNGDIGDNGDNGDNGDKCPQLRVTS